MKINIEKIFKILYTTFYIIIFAIIGFLLFTVFPIKGNYQIKIVQSGSMEPAIKTGSIVFIKPVSSYKIGDIITFEGNFKNAKGQEVLTTHRIVEMRVERGNPIYITKGDANEDADTREVQQSQVVGKVYLVIPYLGYAIETARTTYGFLALIIIPAAIIMWDQGEKILSEIKKMREQKASESEPKNL